eukprot:14516405-Alexandrium_andersonii.AAC.1
MEDWFKEQKETNKKHHKKVFAATHAPETERRYARWGEDAIVDYIPLRTWIIEERGLGHSTSDAIRSFKRGLRGPPCEDPGLARRA